MAGEATIVVIGNLGADAEMRKTPNGKLVTSFNIANTPRIKENNEWIDGETIWYRCFVWGQDATGAANELRKGSRVLITGTLKQNTWIDKENTERKTLEINVEEYGIKPRNVAEPVTLNPAIVTEDPIDDPWA
jgi:single-strand DNA-binding protein